MTSAPSLNRRQSGLIPNFKNSAAWSARILRMGRKFATATPPTLTATARPFSPSLMPIRRSRVIAASLCRSLSQASAADWSKSSCWASRIVRMPARATL